MPKPPQKHCPQRRYHWLIACCDARSSGSPDPRSTALSATASIRYCNGINRSMVFAAVGTLIAQSARPFLESSFTTDTATALHKTDLSNPFKMPLVAIRQ